MSNGKGMIIHLIVGLIKEKPCIKMSQYFPKPYKTFEENINIKVDLSDLKNTSHVDTWRFAVKSNLASLKTEVDQLDIEKLVPVSDDLSKLSDVVKNDFAKKTVYHKLVEKVNNIDASRFIVKTRYDADKSELEKKKFSY